MWIEKSKTEYDNYRIPGLIMTEKGTLLAYYECRRSMSDWADIDLKVKRSCDKGQTWKTVKLVPSDGDTTNNPVMISDGNTVHFLYLKNYKRLFYCQSSDDGLTFTSPIEITDVFNEVEFFYNCVAIGPGHSIIHNGTIIIPVWFANNRDDEKSHLPSFVASIYSKDHGKSWHVGEKIEGAGLVNGNECAYAVTKDGKVLISMRNTNDHHRRYLAISENGYSDWKGLYACENLPDPFCQGSMDSIGGKIFHINCASDSRERINLTVKISENCFETYESVLVDEVGGYSDLVATEEAIYVLYERNANDGLYFKKVDYKN